nr:PHD finger protein 20 isoform X2 [Halyomorpha halys]
MKLKDFSIKLFKLSNHLADKTNYDKCAMSWNSEMHKVNFHTVSEMVEGPSNDYSKFPLKTKRKRVLSRVLKVNRMSRRKMRRFGNARKQRKVNQLIEESQNDDNTTNSENSESNNLYNEINWEENLDCDASALVDEFAPRVQHSLPTSSKSVEEEPDNSEQTALASASDNTFLEGDVLFLKDFHTSEWKSVSILEVDCEDNEVLVHYEDKSKCDEWVSMNSQRLSRTKPSFSSKEDKIDQENDVPEILPIEQTEEEPETESYHVDEEKKYRQRNWKKHRSELSYAGMKSYGASKFVIGEKVLAKWSDHRMQKFPAVIKTVVGDGRYDVLFYDGFEKTISEDHLYKTTEEEVAKYQKTNPSEADIFVDMDANSKEARRQRKRKTFDDYVFARDVKMTRKKGFKAVEGITIKNKLSYFNKGSDNKEMGDLTKPSVHSGRKIRRRRKALFSTRRSDSYKLKLFHTSERPKSESFVSPVSNLSSPQHSPVVKNDVKDVDPSESTEQADDDRWSADLPPDSAPLAITKEDGSIMRSILVPDKYLPEGWSKHAVLKAENDWDIFLVSPDGYKLTHHEELKRYFMDVAEEETPSSLDFLAKFSLLPDLSVQQKNLPLAGTPKVWFRRRNSRGKRGGRAKSNSVPIRSVGRVRTLLPKYRNESSASVIPGSDGEVWKCLKEGCNKKFRKENLLQMHIKHYHSELSSLVRSAPNMVDLACARSQSANSDSLKIPQQTIKRILPRSFSGSPSSSVTDTNSIDPADQPSASLQNSRNKERVDIPSLKRQNTVEERRTTIKTILPIRQPDTPAKMNIDSDENESDGDCFEQKKNGSRIFKPSRFRRGGRGDDDSFEQVMSPTFRFTKKKLSSVDKLQITTDSNDSYTEEEKISPNTEVNDDGIVIERLRSEEIINCTCGFREEDGLMIQCDICMCWQHGLCSGIETESDVPERYICNICRNPYRVRSSKKYSYAQHYLTQGKLPSFSYRARNEETIKERESMLKRCFEISSSIHEIKNVERSLSAKLNIAEQSDHPKLYLWAKNWDEAHIKSEFKRENFANNGDNYATGIKHSGPQPEAPIDLEECRIRLLENVENTFSQLENRLTSIQAQIAALESQDPVCNSVSDKVMKQTIQMLIRDVETIQKLAAIS